MNELTPSEHKARLVNLAALWQQARLDAAHLVGEPAAEAHILEKAAEAAFASAVHAAERAFLLVRHEMTTGVVRVFHAVEIEARHTAAPETIEAEPRPPG